MWQHLSWTSLITVGNDKNHSITSCPYLLWVWLHSHVPSLFPNINVVFRRGKDPVHLTDTRCRCRREVRGHRCHSNTMGCGVQMRWRGGWEEGWCASGGQGSEVTVVLKQRSSLSHPRGHADQYWALMGGWEEGGKGGRKWTISCEMIQGSVWVSPLCHSQAQVCCF